MIHYQEIIAILLIGLTISSCDWNLNADGENGDTEPDTTAIFYNATTSHLPGGLENTSRKVQIGDVDNDGDPDLAIAIQSYPNKILINNGAGKFTDESSARIRAYNYDSHDVTVADFNGDGNLDLFFVGINQGNELYINDGNGNFADLTNRIPASGNATSVTASDINGDGPVDIVIGNLGQNVMLVNNGNAFFSDQTDQRLPQISDATEDIEVADITGNGWLDIIVGNEAANRLFINRGSGFFMDQTSSRIPFPNSLEETQVISIGDVDGDGDRDIYFGNSGFQEDSNPQDRLLINDETGYYSDQTTDRLPDISTSTMDAEFADLDGDGDLDLIVGNYNGGVRVLTNNGNGFFTDQTAAWLPENFAPFVMDLELADFNDDQLLDLYIAVRGGADQLLLQKVQ